MSTLIFLIFGSLSAVSFLGMALAGLEKTLGARWPIICIWVTIGGPIALGFSDIVDAVGIFVAPFCVILAWGVGIDNLVNLLFDVNLRDALGLQWEGSWDFKFQILVGFCSVFASGAAGGLFWPTKPLNTTSSGED